MGGNAARNMESVGGVSAERVKESFVKVARLRFGTKLSRSKLEMGGRIKGGEQGKLQRRLVASQAKRCLQHTDVVTKPRGGMVKLRK